MWPYRFVVRCAVIVAGVIAIAGSAGAQGRLEARFIASIAGITVGQGTWVIDIGDDQYTTAASGHVTGIIRALTNGEGTVAAHGTMTGGHPNATSYAITVNSNGKTDEVRMALAAGNVKDMAVEPPLETGADRIPLTEAHRRNILDPITAGLIPVAGTGDILAPETCQRVLPVFDGRQRFDLVLSFKRMDHVKAEKGYQGPVVVCAVTYQPLAGHRPGRAAIKYLMAARDVEMWLAPIAGTRILAPFRISIPTVIGTAMLEATHFVTAARPPRTNSSSKTH